MSQATPAPLCDRLAGRRLPAPLLWQAFPPEVLDRAEGLPGDRITPLSACIEAAFAPCVFTTLAGEDRP